jgi:SPP1 family holin
MEETRKISAGTVTRLVLLVIALINSGLQLAGYETIPVNEASIGEFISLAFLGATSLWAYWKNNDITKSARNQAK